MRREILLRRGAGGSGSCSDSGSGSESSDDNEPILESTAGQKIPSERSPDLPSREDLYVVQRSWVDPEPNYRGPESNLPLKRDQNINEPATNDSVQKEQQLLNKKNLRKTSVRLDLLFMVL